MYEVIQVAEHTYYVNLGAKIGIYEFAPGRVILIDSGGDKEVGRRVRKAMDEHGWRVSAIVNTHSHADHVGGNLYLQKQYGCKIFAKGIEADFARHPYLEPSLLYGGYPFAELRHKFLMAQESEVSDISDPDFPKELKVIDLPGHFPDMIGLRTPDDVVFAADCVISPETLEKYQVGFLYDVQSYLETLDKIAGMEAKLFIPSHTEPAESLAELARLNREKVLEIAERIKMLCTQPRDFEQLFKALFDELGLTLTVEQYALVGSTLRSYLAWLKDQNALRITIAGNRLLWSNGIENGAQ